LVAAAPNTAVDDLLANFIPLQTKPLNGSDRSLSKHSRVKVDAIVPLAIAFENIIKQSKLRMDETIAVIDMGKSLTDLNIYHSCQLELSRKVSVAGIDLTRSLMSALFTSAGKIELTMEKAESIKREFGIPAPGESYLIQGKITAAQVLSLLRPKLEQLASEISRSFDYYREKIGGGKVDRIILFGGGAQLKGLPEYLNAELGLPVELGNPLHDVDPLCDEVIPNKEDALRLVRAIGASLGEASEINLLPESIREWKSRSVEQMAVIVGMSVFLGILCLSYFGSMARMALMREREAAAKRGYEAVVPQLEKLKNGLLLKRMIRNRADVAGLIRQLSYLPEDVYLTELTLSSGKIYVSGFVSGVDKKAKDSSAQLVAALRRGIMPDAKLLSDTKNVPGKAAKLFEVEGHLGAEGDSK
jgi:hypothetical protein